MPSSVSHCVYSATAITACRMSITIFFLAARDVRVLFILHL
jgi:hypothetical protein